DGVVELTSAGVTEDSADGEIDRGGVGVALLELGIGWHCRVRVGIVPVGVGPYILFAIDRVDVGLDQELGRATVVEIRDVAAGSAGAGRRRRRRGWTARAGCGCRRARDGGLR